MPKHWRFNGVKWNWGSFLIGWHYGRNPVNGQRFLHIGLGPFLGLDWAKVAEHTRHEDFCSLGEGRCPSPRHHGSQR